MKYAKPEIAAVGSAIVECRARVKWRLTRQPDHTGDVYHTGVRSG